MTDETPQPAVQRDRFRNLSELNALGWITGLAYVAAIGLGVAGFAMSTGYVTADELPIIAGLSWWSGFLLTVAVIATVALIVLSGVRELLSRAHPDRQL